MNRRVRVPALAGPGLWKWAASAASGVLRTGTVRGPNVIGSWSPMRDREVVGPTHESQIPFRDFTSHENYFILPLSADLGHRSLLV